MTDPLARVRAEWDRYAAEYDDEPDHGLRDHTVRAAWRDLLVEHLPPAPARVADLGCGSGSLTVLLAEEGCALARWVDLLRPGGRLVLVEGRWSTGAGLPARRTEQLVRRHRDKVTVRHLKEPVYWGREIEDDRYLVVGRA